MAVAGVAAKEASDDEQYSPSATVLKRKAVVYVRQSTPGYFDSQEPVLRRGLRLW